MSDRSELVIREEEREDLYALLIAMDARLNESLVELKLRLERDLYRDHSIAEMEALLQRIGR